MRIYAAAKATIEALSVAEGFTAYATDTNELGTYDGASWTWGVSPTSHAASHKDGGSDELDVSELAGSLGNAGYVPESDGAAVTWVEPDARYDPKDHAHVGTPGDGGQIDHGTALTGLSDDDHTQYLLVTGDRAGATGGAQGMVSGVETDIINEYTLNTGVSIEGLQILDGYIRDGGGFPGAKATTSAMTIPNTSGTVIEFGTEEWDTHSYHDTVTNNSRFTIPSASLAGRYAIGGEFLSAIVWTTGLTYFQVRVNGTVVAQNRVHGTTSSKRALTVYYETELTNGDYVELSIYHNDGGDRDVEASGYMHRLGDAG